MNNLHGIILGIINYDDLLTILVQDLVHFFLAEDLVVEDLLGDVFNPQLISVLQIQVPPHIFYESCLPQSRLPINNDKVIFVTYVLLHFGARYYFLVVDEPAVDCDGFFAVSLLVLVLYGESQFWLKCPIPLIGVYLAFVIFQD